MKNTKKANAEKPKHGHSKLLYFIDHRNSKIVQGRVEDIITKRIPLKNEQTRKVEGSKIEHTYKLSTQLGIAEVCEDCLFETFVQAATKYSLGYYVPLK